MALRRLFLSASAMRPLVASVADTRVSQVMGLAGKSGFDDKEHAMEAAYIRQAEEKVLKKLLAKLKEEESQILNKKVACDVTAQKELEKILGSVPADVAKKLMNWKKTDH